MVAAAEPHAGVAVRSVSFELEPLDVLFLRDGRPFDASVPRATTRVPLPQTVAGALRTWLLRRLGSNLKELATAIKRGASFAEAAAVQGPKPAAVGRLGVRGPWFVKDGERLVPTPATIHAAIDIKEDLYRLDPLADDLPGWTPSNTEIRPLWLRGRVRTEPRAGYLRPGGLGRFLAGGVPLPDEIVDSEALYRFEDRVGIEVNADTRTVSEGMIYTIRLLRLVGGVSLAVDLIGEPEDLRVCPDDEDVLPLGGEARRAIVRRARAHDWPAASGDAGHGRLVLLTAPAPFGGWRPPSLPPIAAAVPGYLPISGWDLARGGPKPNRFAVEAGSVYFVDRNTKLSNRGGSLCRGEDAAVGWGTYVEGVWNYA